MPGFPWSSGENEWNTHKSDPLDPELNRMIVVSIHTDVMEAMAAKGKIVYKWQKSIFLLDRLVRLYYLNSISSRKG